ncbi:tribbles homolog 2-like [Lampetra fluviatilis]
MRLELATRHGVRRHRHKRILPFAWSFKKATAAMSLRDSSVASSSLRRTMKSHKRLHASRGARRRPSLLSSRGCSARVTPDPAPPSASSPVCPLARVDKYVLLEAPSEDRMLRAVDTHTGEELVCKVLELQTWQAVLAPYFHLPVHACVACPSAIVLGETRAYALFERAAGGDARAYVRSRGRLSEEESARLFRQMAEAVAHCHSNGLVLGGLSLRRFVFADAERTHVMLVSLEDAHSAPSDNRFASDLHTEKRGSDFCTSAGGLPQDVGRLDRAVDVWGLGVSLYAMLLGRYPFQEGDGMCWGQNGVTGESLSPEACCLLRALLCYDPAQRLTAPEILEHPWFRTDFTRVESAVAEEGPFGAVGGGGPKGSACDQTVPEMTLVRDCYDL